MIAEDDSQPGDLSDVDILVPGADCPWCFNDALATVRALPGVVDVRASISEGRITVRTAVVATMVLVDTLREHLRGTDHPSFECEMVAVEPELLMRTPVSVAAGSRREDDAVVHDLLHSSCHVTGAGTVARVTNARGESHG